MHGRLRSAAIGYYMLAAKRLQPTLGVIGFNPSVVMRERVGANFALNFPTAHSSSAESTRFCIDPRGMADKDDETMYIDSQFAGHLVSREDMERCAARPSRLKASIGAMCGMRTLTNDGLMRTTSRYHNIRRTSAQTVSLAKFIEEMDRYAPAVDFSLCAFHVMAHDISESNGLWLERCG